MMKSGIFFISGCYKVVSVLSILVPVGLTGLNAILYVLILEQNNCKILLALYTYKIIVKFCWHCISICFKYSYYKIHTISATN